MVTYLYWLLIGALVFLALFGVGVRMHRWKPAFILAAVVLVVGSGLYYFWLEQMFVKRWGGTMTISVPDGQRHIAATWKQDNLWIENYDPETNTCIFREYSRGNVLEGQVKIKDCNPLHGGTDTDQPLPAVKQ